MRFIKVKYFKSGMGVMKEDFHNVEKMLYLNIDLISEISSLETPIFSNVPKYFWIRMNNGIVYNCTEVEYDNFIKKIINLSDV